MQGRPRYSKQDKERYLQLCRDYYQAALVAVDNPQRFIQLSLQLHQAKATVPKSWRTEKFVKEHGAPLSEAEIEEMANDPACQDMLADNFGITL